MLILCTYRDAESSQAALEAARRLVGDGGEVVIIHVVELAEMPRQRASGHAVEQAEKEMDAREARIRGAAEAAGLRASVVVDVPDPTGGTPERIAREAREREADMVVVVSKRASGIRGLLLGSVAQALLQLAPCPVLVVRPGD